MNRYPQSSNIVQPIWPQTVLRLAAAYNILWGAWQILAPLGYLISDVPDAFGYTLITNDLAWWVPFGIMLVHAKRAGFPLRSV